ncbi:MAG: hypothetical protein Q9224_004472 [Gallowayella concinna]
MGKDKLALDIYKYGLRKVPDRDPKLQAAVNIHQADIRQYVHLSQNKAVKAVMSRFAMQRPDNLHHIVSGCKGLEHLEFRSGYSNASLIKATSIAENLRCLLLSERCETTLDCLSQILGKCKNLVRAEFHLITIPSYTPQWQGDMSSLQILTMKISSKACTSTVPSFGPLIERIPQIRELNLERWKSETAIPTAGLGTMAHLQKLRLVGFQGEVNPRALPSLRILELRACDLMLERFSALSTRGTPDLRAGGVTELSLPSANYLRMNTLLQLLGSTPLGLRRLSLFHCAMINAIELNNLICMGYMDHVVELDLSGTRVTDTVIESLAGRAQQLKMIRLAQTEITGVAVKALVRNRKSKLKHLDIRRCYCISSDAVAFARHLKGLTVDSNRQESNGKKKIRYE